MILKSEITPSTYPVIRSIPSDTFYVVMARWPREIRLMTVEWTEITNDAEALECVKQHDHAVRVIRCDYDVPYRDVSEDIARLWLRALIAEGFNPEEDTWPDFISEHLTNDDAVREYTEGYHREAAE